MTGFLQHIAQTLLSEHREDMSRVTLVFPNRRAGLYLKETIRQSVSETRWSPRIITLREMVDEESAAQVKDPLTLVYHLHKVYCDVMNSEETFEEFYFWGQMLLKDFDELDKYLVNARVLYTDLSKQKELDLTFEFLTREQRDLIERFWRGIQKKDARTKEQFLNVWRHLYAIYEEFNRRLDEEGMAYEGRLFRSLAETLDTHTWKNRNEVTWFAGFNALTQTEEILISHFIDNFDAKIFWDLDAYYLDDSAQEAGRFFRQYRKKRVFSSSFEGQIPNTVLNARIDAKILGVSQYVGQAKVCATDVANYLAQHPSQDLRKVAIILAEESLLLPVLHSLPEQVERVNVTMGFPLAFAPLSGFIELLIELIELSKMHGGVRQFHFRPTLALYAHPMLGGYALKLEHESKDDGKRLFYPATALVSNEITSRIFGKDPSDFLEYLISVLEELGAQESITEIENSYIFHYLSHLHRYRELVEGKVSVETFRKLFRQLVRMDRVPFTGEPLEGIQIMGVLETRNLDFDTIFILGMNEEAFPGGKNTNSYVPYNLRKAYGLPHFDQQDAIYAYLFYRLFHHATYARLYYNTEGNDLGGEEMSRFLKQLIFEKPFPVSRTVLSNIPRLTPIGNLHAKGNGGRLDRYLAGGESHFSPSAINVYLDCKLKFYYRYVAQLYINDEQEESLDSRTLGSLVHECIEAIYEPFVGKTLTSEDIKACADRVDEFLETALRSVYGIKEDEQFAPEGKNRVARSVAKRFIEQILKTDQGYAPFELLGQEKKYIHPVTLKDGRKVQLGGSIDRVDSKDGMIRILDLKTGKDELDFKNFNDLFSEKNRKKAIFQTMFYALLYPEKPEHLVPAVYNKNVLFQGDSWMVFDNGVGSHVNSFASYRDEFVEKLQEVLEEIFSEETEFNQVTDDSKCKYCDYKGICNRG